ncbi:acetylcholine receptor subunit alpha-like 1 isoform X2 [Saccostrea echinata]|uniref:acetylcholine receptor subunit alpha-like 1 isoform X2 n=1 Tax=Saccostrea echinata TaxID=191078 RepID=UPI002A7EC24D|nr:acetylcholine receptor subunit alpha-like 1 isoform X2 [Saccostrea echinata]
MRLSQLLNIDEKNQIMKTSVWLHQEWFDKRLIWNPQDFGGINMTQIPSTDLWKPDIVLYNNADGDFIVTHKTKAKVYNTGKIVWEPPAIYKSYCPIDVEFFPFDRQECFMKFGSWTYDMEQIDLEHICDEKAITYIVGDKEERVIDRGVDLKDFYFNVQWDIINVTATWREKSFPCCDVSYPFIIFNITLRRRPMFYSLNLIMPCLSISGLTVLVFYLPSDSGEKITLSISILLALTVFFLLLSDINPPTSFVIPLIGKYLLFTMILVTLSIFLAVSSIRITNRKPSTHNMSPWVKRVFTDILPSILRMRRPGSKKNIPSVIGGLIHCVRKDYHCSLHLLTPNDENKPISGEFLGYPKHVQRAVIGVKFIADNLRKNDEVKMEELDWKYIAMVVDRLFLYLFSAACLCGTLTIFLYAPSLHDPRDELTLQDNTEECLY